MVVHDAAVFVGDDFDDVLLEQGFDPRWVGVVELGVEGGSDFLQEFGRGGFEFGGVGLAAGAGDDG